MSGSPKLAPHVRCARAGVATVAPTCRSAGCDAECRTTVADGSGLRSLPTVSSPAESVAGSGAPLVRACPERGRCRAHSSSDEQRLRSPTDRPARAPPAGARDLRLDCRGA
eukprot:scaffold4772_cov27-Tisochrysis_lutea.AAC.2